MNEVELTDMYQRAALESALNRRPESSIFAVAYIDPKRPDVAVVAGPTIPCILLEIPDEVSLEGTYLVAACTKGGWKSVRHQNLDWFWPEALEGLARYAGQRVDAGLADSMSHHPAGKRLPA